MGKQGITLVKELASKKIIENDSSYRRPGDKVQSIQNESRFTLFDKLLITASYYPFSDNISTSFVRRFTTIGTAVVLNLQQQCQSS
jgi:hypothetical protein